MTVCAHVLSIVQGEKIRRELLEKVKTLPETFAAITEKASVLAPVVEFYHTFVQYTLDR